MSNLMKRQHYVWRNYLRAWSSKESIFTYFKQLDKLRQTNLMSVAQEKYFYELPNLTEEEEQKLKDFINQLCHDSLQNFCEDTFQLFTRHNSIMRDANYPQLSDEKQKSIDKKVREFKVNTMEKLHCQIEKMGNTILEISSVTELENLSEDELNESITFLCFQFIRTKAMQNAVSEAVNNHPISEFTDKVWSILTFILALNMARAISLRQNKKIILLKNKSDNKFITGDQPIFNTLAEKDKKEEVTDLEFYYPISPSIALLINFDSNTSKFSKKEINSEMAEMYNSLIYDWSDFFVFSASKKQLETYQNA